MRRLNQACSVLPLIAALALAACDAPPAAAPASAAPVAAVDAASAASPISPPALSPVPDAPPAPAGMDPAVPIVPVVATAVEAAPAAPPAPVDVVFFDADVFDTQLSDAMAKQGVVTVKTIDGVTLNEMPKRLNTWLSAIQDRGGKVTVMTPPAVNESAGKTRGLEGIVFDVFTFVVQKVYSHYHEAHLYGPADGYDATLVTMPGSSRLQEIRFTRKDS